MSEVSGLVWPRRIGQGQRVAHRPARAEPRLPTRAPIMKGTPAAICVPAPANLPAMPASLVCTTTTPGAWKPGAATRTSPFSSQSILWTMSPGETGRRARRETADKWAHAARRRSQRHGCRNAGGASAHLAPRHSPSPS
eukprot:scaffold160839_cov36-Tisochrysis_lutea.AAC.3